MQPERKPCSFRKNAGDIISHTHAHTHTHTHKHTTHTHTQRVGCFRRNAGDIRMIRYNNNHVLVRLRRCV